MPLIENDTALKTNNDGHLENANDWNKKVCVEFADAENITLSAEHWEIINFLRDFYQEYKITPSVRVLTKAIGEKLGGNKGNTKYLYQLFPKGFARQACKLAGLPKPNGCH